ncbi:hypothetical protein [Saccharopolyspora shandongensis]|uniref:hypothetical protein n=1 Tax=Saccharopolyspora shandongensis TaxID=418495 RepID=UPI0033C5F696
MGHFITTNPAARDCEHCGAVEVTGFADGLAYRLSMLPVTSHGELRARIAGLRTWGLAGDGRPVYRGARLIQARPADSSPVFASHRCSAPIPYEDTNIAFAAVSVDLVAKWRRPATDGQPSGAEVEVLDLFSAELGARVVAVEPAPF